ncbi:MAG: hypothetical protein ACK55I_22455, partial [bacterium]
MAIRRVPRQLSAFSEPGIKPCRSSAFPLELKLSIAAGPLGAETWPPSYSDFLTLRTDDSIAFTSSTERWTPPRCKT